MMVRFEVDKYIEKYDSGNGEYTYKYKLVPLNPSGTDHSKVSIWVDENKKYQEGDILELSVDSRQTSLEDKE